MTNIGHKIRRLQDERCCSCFGLATAWSLFIRLQVPGRLDPQVETVLLRQLADEFDALGADKVEGKFCSVSPLLGQDGSLTEESVESPDISSGWLTEKSCSPHHSEDFHPKV